MSETISGTRNQGDVPVYPSESGPSESGPPERRVSILCLLVSIPACLLFLGYFMITNPWVLDLGREDGPIEYLGALFFGLACALCVRRMVRNGDQTKALLIGWALLNFLFVGEELSWFQRILGYDTVAFLSVENAQQEFNLHNLTVFAGGKLAEASGEGLLSWRFLRFLLSPQNLLRFGFLFYFLVLPLGMSNRYWRRWGAKFGYRAPHVASLLMIWSVVGISLVFQLLGPPDINRLVVETREMFYAFFIMIYVYPYLKEYASVTHGPPTREIVFK